MAFTIEDAQALEEKLTGEGGVIEKITTLATAEPEERKTHIIPLIGSIIGLIISAISAAID